MRHLASVTHFEWEPYLGKTDTLQSVWLLGRYPIKVQDFWVPAVEAMEKTLIAMGYENPCDYTGSYMKRPIAGTDIWSWHSYGGAIDLDYGGDTDGDGDPTIDKNPHIHRRIHPGDPGFGVEWQILEPQVNAIEAIRTNSGGQVWHWLGWNIGDTMHFEPRCTPDDAKTGERQLGTDPDRTAVENKRPARAGRRLRPCSRVGRLIQRKPYRTHRYGFVQVGERTGKPSSEGIHLEGETSEQNQSRARGVRRPTHRTRHSVDRVSGRVRVGDMDRDTDSVSVGRMGGDHSCLDVPRPRPSHTRLAATLPGPYPVSRFRPSGL